MLKELYNRSPRIGDTIAWCPFKTKVWMKGKIKGFTSQFGKKAIITDKEIRVASAYIIIKRDGAKLKWIEENND